VLVVVLIVMMEVGMGWTSVLVVMEVVDVGWTSVLVVAKIGVDTG